MVRLADYKLNILDRVPDHYFRNLAKVKAAADRAGLEVIPAVFPIGYSAGLLAHDPNLAEGVPVEEAPFVVKGREAVPAGPGPAYRNGDLEDVRGDRFVGFSSQDDPGVITFADREVVHGGKVSCRMQDTGRGSSFGNCRLIQRVELRPHAVYRFSAWVKTRDLKRAGEFSLLALGLQGSRQLTFYEGGLPETGDWRQVSVVFNSLDQSAANLYIGCWGGKTGTLWIDDLKLEELGLVNVLRREGCPLRVVSADGKTTYEEGRDFEPVRDPKLGMVPYAGEYEFDHAGPTIRLTPNSRIRDGEALKVSWYHPLLVHGNQMTCCLTEPKVYELLTDQARRVENLLHPKTFFMSHDEFRVGRWCRSCRASGKTAGELLAENARKCVEILKNVSPRANIAVWSDMFDPNHNAVDNYYLVDGTLRGSWEGLPREVIVVNWNGGKASQSLTFFAERGHRQVIAGFYDEPGLANFERWDRAARGIPGVEGFMYTTWQNNFRDLDTYGQAIRPK